MSVASIKMLRENYGAVRALGSKAVSSDFVFHIPDYPNSYLMIDQAPHAMLASGGEIEVPGPLGTAHFEPQQAKVNQQGSISLVETVDGKVETMLLNMLTSGQQYRFDAYIISGGNPTNYRMRWKYRDCFFVPEVVQRDWSNRQELFKVNGTLFFHYFGEVEIGNITGTGNGVNAGLSGFEANQ